MVMEESGFAWPQVALRFEKLNLRKALSVKPALETHSEERGYSILLDPHKLVPFPGNLIWSWISHAFARMLK